jgi:hypothetical protein
MRTIHICVTALGLALLLCSWVELTRVRQYRIAVKQVQQKALEKDKYRIRELRRFNVTVTEFPSMEAILSELDAPSGLERGWWVASGIGAAVFAVGLVGMFRAERLRRKSTANNVLEATAG